MRISEPRSSKPSPKSYRPMPELDKRARELIAHPGIMAVATKSDDGTKVRLFTEADEDHRGRILELAMSISELSKGHVYLTIKPYGTINAEPVGDIGTVAVLTVYGHSVTKSVRRMMRRLGQLMERA